MKPRAFTLVELLVVIGIIALIAGLLLPAVLRAYKSANRTRTEADLHLIETSLDEYRNQFGDYPRFDDDNTAGAIGTRTDRGAVLLCRALIGPGDSSVDGLDGNGFRVRPGGKPHDPMLDTSKFRLSIEPAGTSSPLDPHNAWVKILDSNNNPILYYPATPAANPTISYCAAQTPPGIGVAVAAARPMFNAIDNTAAPAYVPDYPSGRTLLTITDMQTILGAVSGVSGLGPVDSTNNRAAAFTGPYILWAAGADGQYGLDGSRKTDDVTNFDIPPNYRK